MEILLIAVVLGIIPGMIAHNRGHSFWSWWLFGALLFIVALPMALMLKPNTGELVSRGEGRQCPYCAELIKPQAVVCRFCGRDLPDDHVKVASLRAQLLEYVFDNPDSTSKEIAEGIEWSTVQVRQELDAMRKDGLSIWRRGERWILTPKGAAVVPDE